MSVINLKYYCGVGGKKYFLSLLVLEAVDVVGPFEVLTTSDFLSVAALHALPASSRYALFRS